MEQLVITGGRALKGRVRVSGAKNAALPMLVASLLARGETQLDNLPRVRDVATMIKLMQELGVRVKWVGARSLLIDPLLVNNFRAPYELVCTMRASILVLGPLLARWGQAEVSLPGGCAIGSRPVDLHLKALQALGAEITLEEGYIKGRAKSLTGCSISLDLPTVTGTENIMLAAVLARGETIIENPAREPEVIDLALMLRTMGARIEGVGSEKIVITGVSELTATNYSIIPDRIEAASFMVAAAITGGEIEIEACQPQHLGAEIAKLRQAGSQVIEGEEYLQVIGGQEILPLEIKTAPYPGFPTDMQAQFMALATIAAGTSIITETIFENRFMHVLELVRMGADIKIEGHSAFIRGVPHLIAAPVMATDLRASASLVLAALAANGESVISRIYHLDRGYEQLDQKLSQLGANIKRIKK